MEERVTDITVKQNLPTADEMNRLGHVLELFHQPRWFEMTLIGA